MPEADFELRIRFEDRHVRDRAVEFLSGQGPAFDEEVAAPFRTLYLALEDIELPSEIKKQGEYSLTAYFEIYGGEAMFEAQDYIDSFAKGGAKTIYGYYSDDDEVEIYWTFKDNEVQTLYEAHAVDEIDDILWNLDEEQRLEKVIALKETGRL